MQAGDPRVAAAAMQDPLQPRACLAGRALGALSICAQRGQALYGCMCLPARHEYLGGGRRPGLLCPSRRNMRNCRYIHYQLDPEPDALTHPAHAAEMARMAELRANVPK